MLNQDHVERLTSGEWVSSPNGTHGQPRPTCDNHDDGETPAIILCMECGNLCADCDRFLHLHRKKRLHQRQVYTTSSLLLIRFLNALLVNHLGRDKFIKL